MISRFIYNERLLVQERIPYSKRGGESGLPSGKKGREVCRGGARFRTLHGKLKYNPVCNTLLCQNQANQMASKCSSPCVVDTFLGRIHLSYWHRLSQPRVQSVSSRLTNAHVAVKYLALS